MLGTGCHCNRKGHWNVTRTGRPKPTVLGLSFFKDLSDLMLVDVEQELLYGLSTLVNYLTPIDMVLSPPEQEYTTLRTIANGDADLMHLTELGRSAHANYVLYGKIRSVSEPTAGVSLWVYLFDVERGQHLLKAHYPFIPMESSRGYLPSWECLVDCLRWMSCQLVGILVPEKALNYWTTLMQSSLTRNHDHFQRLVVASQLHAEKSAGQKIAMLTALCDADPGLFPALLEMATLLQQANRHGEAIRYLEKAFWAMSHVMPRQRAECLMETGVCYALVGNIPKAVDCWKQAILEDSLFVSPYLNLAHAYEEAGQLDEAEYFFRQAEQVAPQDNRVYFNLARLYSKQERWPEAISQYQYQLMLEPDNAWIYSDLANCELQQGNVQKAKVYLLKTLELDSEGEAARCAQLILDNFHAAESFSHEEPPRLIVLDEPSDFPLYGSEAV